MLNTKTEIEDWIKEELRLAWISSYLYSNDSTPAFEYKIRDDLSLEITGDFHLLSKHDGSLPVSFHSVSGDFDISKQKLTTLEGCPEYVGGNFHCWKNNLTSLENGPTEVGGAYFCWENKLKTLEGLARKIGGDFSCVENDIKRTGRIDTVIGGKFECDDGIEGLTDKISRDSDEEDLFGSIPTNIIETDVFNAFVYSTNEKELIERELLKHTTLSIGADSKSTIDNIRQARKEQGLPEAPELKANKSPSEAGRTLQQAEIKSTPKRSFKI